MGLIRVMLVDGRPMVREALRFFSEEEPGMKVVAGWLRGHGLFSLTR